MGLTFGVLFIAGLLGVWLSRERSTFWQAVSAGGCLLGALGFTVVMLWPEPPPPGSLDLQGRSGNVIGRQIRASGMETGEIVLVAWPEIDRGMINLADRMQEGLEQEVGREVTIRRHAMPGWEGCDREQLFNGQTPRAQWAALAESLPDAEVVVSMVGHPKGSVSGLFTRCRALYIDDSFTMTLEQGTARLDPKAPLAGYTTFQPGKPHNSLLDAVTWVKADPVD